MKTADVVEAKLAHSMHSNRRDVTQPVLLTRPQRGVAKIPVKCEVCGKEISIYIASRSRAKRFGRILQIVFGVVAALFFVFMLWFGLVASDPAARPSTPDWIILCTVGFIIIAGLPFILSPLLSKPRLLPHIEASDVEAKGHYVVQPAYSNKQASKLADKPEQTKIEKEPETPGSVSRNETISARIELMIKLLEFLENCGEFDHDKMGIYLSMAEQGGMEFSPDEKTRLLESGTLILSEPQPDGTRIGGYERLRRQFVEANKETITELIKLIK